MAALAFGAGTALQPCFAWSLLVLLGVGRTAALLYSLHRRRLRPLPMAEAAKDLRAVLSIPASPGGRRLLVLSPAAGPVSVLLFAACPAFRCRCCSRTRAATLAF